MCQCGSPFKIVIYATKEDIYLGHLEEGGMSYIIMKETSTSVYLIKTIFTNKV